MEYSSSPPLADFCAPSPASSDPPIFSSDGPLEDEDVSNYSSPRIKRERRRRWWEAQELEEPFNAHRKKPETVQNDQTGELERYEEDGEGRQRRIDLAKAWMDNPQARFFQTLADSVYMNQQVYDFRNKRLGDLELSHIHLLNQVVRIVSDPGCEVPAEGQFRSMVPEIILSLQRNRFTRLHPNLFRIEHLTFLSLAANKLENLPPQICQLHNLKYLDISHNRLAYLPHELQYLFAPFGKLESLVTAHNPFVQNVGRDWNREEYWWHRVFSSEADLWCIAWAEAFLADFKTFGRVRESFRAFIACSSIAYYDEVGRLLTGSSPLPRTPRDWAHTMVPTSRGNVCFYEPGEFQLPMVSKVPSLVQLSLKKAVETECPYEIEKLLFGDIPSVVQVGLRCAEENVTKCFSPLQICRCGEEYVIKRAEWIEWWSDGSSELIPFKSQVCSWECAEKMHTKSYLKTGEKPPFASNNSTSLPVISNGLRCNPRVFQAFSASTRR